VTETFVSISKTLRRVTETLVSISETLRRVTETLVSISKTLRENDRDAREYLRDTPGE